MKLKKWAIKHAAIPILAVASISIMLAGIVIERNLNSREQFSNSHITQLKSMLAISLDQKNRTLTDYLMESSKTTLGAKFLAVCRGTNSLTQAGEFGFRCDSQAGLLTKRIETSLVGSNEYRLVAIVNRFSYSNEFMGVIAISVASILFSVLVAGSLFRNFKSQILIPLSDPLQINSSHPISEIENIRRTYLQLLDAKTKHAVTNALLDRSRQIAHDIRSPLSAIQVASSLLPSDEISSVLKSASVRLNEIAKELLGDRPQKANFENLDRDFNGRLQNLIQEKKLEMQTQGNEIELNLSMNTNSIEVPQSFSTDILRITSNLLNNSLEAIEQNGEIQVVVNDNESHRSIVVNDNGVGIPTDVLNRLGERGFSYGVKPSKSGTGLGLWGAKCALQKWGGTMQIQSKVGFGTRVEISVPFPPP